MPYPFLHLTIESWHAWIGHLGYRSLFDLLKLTNGIEIQGPVSTKICNSDIKACLQQNLSQTQMTNVMEFL